jgi:hypothetical protein
MFTFLSHTDGRWLQEMWVHVSTVYYVYMYLLRVKLLAHATPAYLKSYITLSEYFSAA